MNLTIDISADLESRLLREATKRGMGLDEYVIDALRTRLATENISAACLNPEESRLMEEINLGLSQAEWDRYYELIERRRSEALSENEFEELQETSDRVEELDVRRMQCLSELARLRDTTLPELLDQLGIVPPPVI